MTHQNTAREQRVIRQERLLRVTDARIKMFALQVR